MTDGLYLVSVTGCTCRIFLADWLEKAMLGGWGGGGAGSEGYAWQEGN